MDVYSLLPELISPLNCIPQGILIRSQPARSLTDLLTALATIFDGASLTTFRCCIQPGRSTAKEYRILESVNSKVGTYTLGNCVKLFEVRLFLRAKQLQQHFPQVTRPLLSRVFSCVLASGALCIANDHVQTAHSPWNPCQVASVALQGSSHA